MPLSSRRVLLCAGEGQSLREYKMGRGLGARGVTKKKKYAHSLPPHLPAAFYVGTDALLVVQKCAPPPPPLCRGIFLGFQLLLPVRLDDGRLSVCSATW